MIVLTGPPRFAGILRHPSRDGWLECWWDDSESVWHVYDDGSMQEWERRVQLVGSCTFEGASEQEALALASDLRGVFPVVPRTRANGDPEWAEETVVLCRRTSRLPATRPRCDFDATGVPVWTVKVEIESVQVFGDVPGAVEGGYEVTGRSATSAALRPYGGATVALAGTREVVFMGEQFTRSLGRLGPGSVAATRVAPTPDGRHAVVYTRPEPDA